MKICEKCGEALVECGCNNWVDVNDNLPAAGETCEVRLNAVTKAYHIPDGKHSMWITDAQDTLEATISYWRYIKEEVENEMDFEEF